ncbi:hypothetical protein L6255_03700 [Candidatus Parcubacteria bacterium]|nr:hypothetical protein [Patescibacteria group bacterium]MCG2689516.1 hypothetical protein [Candidatus Parcubacteria bacterium]
MATITGGLTAGEEETLIGLLGKVAQPWTERFYNSVNRITALTAVYQVILRRTEAVVEVFLTPREDKIYHDKVHHPGSMVRWTDKPGFFPDAIARVKNGELGGVEYATEPHLAGVILTDTPRGKEISVVLICETTETPNVPGNWHSVSNLPANLIEHEVVLNKMAVVKYEEMARRRHESIPL